MMNHNLKEAMRFLQLLDPIAKAFTFQTFDDSRVRKEARNKTKPDPFARIIEGTLGSVAGNLAALNKQSAGVYVTINQTRLDGNRNAESITRVRAVFADLDDASLDPVKACALQPHIIVESSPGKYQVFWLVASLPLANFKAIQKAIIARFSSDPCVHDLPRVMRMPGFYHCKAEPFQCRIIEFNDELPHYKASEILAEFPPVSEDSKSNDNQKSGTLLTVAKIADGKRNASLLSMAGSLRGNGLSQAEIERILLDANHARCENPLDDGEVLSIAKRYQAASANDENGLTWGTPEPIPNNLPTVPPFDADKLLPATLAPWVKDIAERMQCPIDYVGVAIMIACGSVIGSRFAVRPKQVDTWCEVPNLWGIIIGRSGDKKTPALSEALAPLRKLQETARTSYEQAIGQHQLDVMQHKLTLDTKKSNAKSGKHTLSLSDLNAPTKPPERRYIVNDTTVEALGLILQDNPTGTLAFADEVVALLSRLDGEEQRPARSFYLEAYNGKSSFSVDRITRDHVHIPRLWLSFHA